MKKQCKDCFKTKPKDEFYGIQGDCKECTKKRVRKNSRSIKRKCCICKKIFGTCISEIKRGGGKFCSRECWYKWNQGKNMHNWKGDSASYIAIHKWISNKLGKPKFCEMCKSTKEKMYHWSNISGKYNRKISDWQRLCVKCHSKYDLSKRKEITIKCKVCSNNIKTKSKKRKFCTKTCSSRYYRRIK